MKIPLRIVKNSQHYQDRAEECRTIADWLIGEEPKRKMLGIAETYEQMAELARRLEEDT